MYIMQYYVLGLAVALLCARRAKEARKRAAAMWKGPAAVGSMDEILPGEAYSEMER